MDVVRCPNCQAVVGLEPAPKFTAYHLAARFLHFKETPGAVANPQILAMLQLDTRWPEDDRVPWCSAFVNYIAWLMDLPRSRSLRARSWLKIGQAIKLEEAKKGYDVVVLSRGGGVQPGPDVIEAPGHVGFFSDEIDSGVILLGGNQSDSVSLRAYPFERILGVRRILEEGVEIKRR